MCPHHGWRITPYEKVPMVKVFTTEQERIMRRSLIDRNYIIVRESTILLMGILATMWMDFLIKEMEHKKIKNIMGIVVVLVVVMMMMMITKKKKLKVKVNDIYNDL